MPIPSLVAVTPIISAISDNLIRFQPKPQLALWLLSGGRAPFPIHEKVAHSSSITSIPANHRYCSVQLRSLLAASLAVASHLLTPKATNTNLTLLMTDPHQ